MRAERLGESWADWRCNVSSQEEQQFPHLLDRVPVEGDPLPIGFVCEWPGRGIAESRAEIDAASILQAAGRAVTLWSDE